jgi:hypothetical protein
MTETSTELTPSAAEIATAEHREIMLNPNHRLYAAFRRGDEAAHQYVGDLYRRAYPSDPAATPPIPVPPEVTDEERVAAQETDAMLRSVLGEQYESTMRDMRSGAARLFASSDHVKALDLFIPLLTELGPAGEVAGIKFLAEVGRLHHNHTGGIR